MESLTTSRGRGAWLSARWLAVGLPFLCLVVLWQTLGPTALGGSATYVVTSGTSMLPDMEAGGVAVLREQRSYNAGDVVGYRNESQGTVILHRIVRRDGAGFVLKGDNNELEDVFHPVPSQILGERWLYLPHAGRGLLFLQQPAAAGLLLTLITFVALYQAPRRPHRHRRRHR